MTHVVKLQEPLERDLLVDVPLQQPDRGVFALSEGGHRRHGGQGVVVMPRDESRRKKSPLFWLFSRATTRLPRAAKPAEKISTVTEKRRQNSKEERQTSRVKV